jgi:hypothetical protein
VARVGGRGLDRRSAAVESSEPESRDAPLSGARAPSAATWSGTDVASVPVSSGEASSIVTSKLAPESNDGPVVPEGPLLVVQAPAVASPAASSETSTPRRERDESDMRPPRESR